MQESVQSSEFKSTQRAEQVAVILEFLMRIGLPVQRTSLPGPTFLPGVAIGGGALLVDESKLACPGDLLHEAGHMAVMTPAERAECMGNAGEDGGAELAAMAWSFAAAVELGMNARVVFHAEGYKGGGESIAANFEQGRYFGVPLLQWHGLTKEPLPQVGMAAPGVYPQMNQWLRS